MADWKSFEIQVPGKELLEPVRNVLETLLIFLEVLKAILDTIKIFLVDFGNPIRALVEALIRLIEELFLALKQTGFYAYFDIPNPLRDPNFDQHSGGFKAFTERFKASLYDDKDFSRPQPRSGSTKSGFVLMVVDAASPFALLQRVKTLLKFFGREFFAPRYEAPDNLKALPVGSKGDPILAVASVFSEGPIKAIQLSWSLASNVETPDPGFSDVVPRTSKELIPSRFLIERSTLNPAFGKIDLSDLGTVDKSGQVEFDNDTTFEVGGVGQTVKRREILRDDYGEPVIKFQKYTVIDETDITSILGQLGKFRYIDSDIQPDVTYYYRVRAFSGDLKMAGNQVAFPTNVGDLLFTPESRSRVLQWPAEKADEIVVLGKPSGIVSASVPVVTDPGIFDVVDNLRRVYQASFSLDFHLRPADDSTFGSDGLPTLDTPISEVGKGSMTSLSGPLAAFESFPILGDLSRTTSLTESFKPSEITGKSPEMPWQKYSVRRQSARLADASASALLQAGSGALNDFRSLMTGTLPAGGVVIQIPIAVGKTATPSSLQALVKGLTFVDSDGTVELIGARAYVDSYTDVNTRLNILAAVTYLKTFTGTGVPPDWISVVPLRDIIPWSGQIIYDLLDKVNALLAAFKGVMDEVNAFIALLERKINALERFIEFLLNILSFIEALEIGAFVLNASGVEGTVQSWVNILDSAGGVKPPSGPGGYSAGVGLAYVAADIAAFEKAFSIIFG